MNWQCTNAVQRHTTAKFLAKLRLEREPRNLNSGNGGIQDCPVTPAQAKLDPDDP